jgi:hypothetical protein
LLCVCLCVRECVLCQADRRVVMRSPCTGAALE